MINTLMIILIIALFIGNAICLRNTIVILINKNYSTNNRRDMIIMSGIGSIVAMIFLTISLLDIIGVM